jgi:predicted secreted hydrolase
MSVRAFLIWLCMVGVAFAQGFAGLDQAAKGFALPIAGKALEFPRDHGAHPDYRIEWWYVTANLQGDDGADYGVQWTLFRTSLAPSLSPSLSQSAETGWSSPQLWMGHAALTTKTQHFVAERLGRGGIGQAGVSLDPFSAWIDNWQLKGKGSDAVANLSMTASGQDFSYALQLNATGPLVLQGLNGYSVKSAQGQASYYYSQPSYQVSGTLNLPTGPVQVKGNAWLDHEWSSQPLASDQTGWDWFSLHFDNGEKLMGFRLRDAGAGFTSATWIAADGKPEAQSPGSLKVTPLETASVAGRTVPIRWRIELPAHGIDVTTKAINPNTWMATQIPYWEGPVRFEGSKRGKGYVEMTGYE